MRDLVGWPRPRRLLVSATVRTRAAGRGVISFAREHDRLHLNANLQVIDTGTHLVPIEVRLSSTPQPRMAAGIEALRRDLGRRVAPGYVVHPGRVQLPRAPGVTTLPIAEF